MQFSFAVSSCGNGIPHSKIHVTNDSFHKHCFLGSGADTEEEGALEPGTSEHVSEF